jgi:glycerophosphoryl diester phosphodiesterase
MYSNRSLPEAISHRGLHDELPENTIPAFEAAINAGAVGIELDVHATADDVLFVHHDPHVAVDGSRAAIVDLDSKSISSLRLEGDITIPTLDATLEALGARVAVFIEIKAAGIEHTVTRCLRRHPQNLDAYAVHSFDHRIVKRMLELIPSVRTGVLQGSYPIDSCAIMRAAGATDLWQHAEFIDASLVAGVHACGGRVIAWTPNDAAHWERLSAAGVDCICTDRIGEYVDWRSKTA